MLSVTSGLKVDKHAQEPGKINVILETLALFFVTVFLIAMLLAMTTVLQNGLQ